MKKLLILGSSRSDGDTAQLAKKIKEKTNWDLIDLNDYQISYFDYQHRNKGDDYLTLINHILPHYDTLIFLTPVYWYAMSGILKVFFDRFTDLLTIEKELGRKLKAKKMAALSCSTGNNLGKDFWLPFSKTAAYLGMDYLGGFHTIAGAEEEEGLEMFLRRIKKGKLQ